MSHHSSKNDRIPTYEESIATSSNQPFPQEKSVQRPSLQQRIRQERLRKITNLVCEDIEPCISLGLEDGLNRMSIVLLPSDAFSISTTVTEESIVTPSLQANTNLIRLAGDDYKCSFLQQQVVVQELSAAVHNALADPNLSPPQAQAVLAQTIPVGNLPTRPVPKSWIKRTFGLPPEDHDPTGTTGSWDLGWRSQDRPDPHHRTITVDDIAINTRLQDVSFRTESVLGLLESKMVRCVWLDIELPS